jgi:hypothetical protein
LKNKTQNQAIPFGYWRYAKEFADAGHVVLSNSSSQISMPALFLLGQSIELSLKAFLLKKGVSIEKLRNKPYRHDLFTLIKESRRRKLGREVKLTVKELANVELLNIEYKDRNFQYIKTGYIRVPFPSVIDKISYKLVNGLKKYCSNLG